MKKSIKIFMATLVALTLAACGNENNKKSSSSETKTTQKSNVSKESKKTEQSSESSSSSSSSSSESSSSEVSSSSQSGPQQAKVTGDNNTQRMAQIAGALKYFLGKDALVPTKAGISSGVVNAYYTGDDNNFTVYYIKDTEGKNFNDPSLKDKVSYITFSKKTYGSGNQKIEWNNGKAVYTIKGSNINSLIELAGSIQK